MLTLPLKLASPVTVGVVIVGDVRVLLVRVSVVVLATNVSVVAGNVNVILPEKAECAGAGTFSTGLIDLKNDGSQSAIRLYCESSNAHYAALQAPAHSAFSGNITLTLPATTDTLVARTTTDTLTNKTLTSPTISTPTLTGGVGIADSIFHTGDTNTQLRFPAADTFTVETGGSERLRVDSGGVVKVGSTTLDRDWET